MNNEDHLKKIYEILLEINKSMAAYAYHQKINSRALALLARIHDPDNWRKWFGFGVKLTENADREIKAICDAMEEFKKEIDKE